MHATTLVRGRPALAVRAGLLALAAALWLAAAPAPAADPPEKAGPGASIKITQDPPSVQIETHTGDDADAKSGKDAQGKSRKRSVGGMITFDNDQEFEDFKNIKKTAPWFIGVMFLFVGALFLTPIILLVGIVWYKLRKTKMQNEALLRLAERGVIAPAQAIDAVGSGVMPTAPGNETAGFTGISGPGAAGAAGGFAGIASAATAYEQAMQTRRRAVWSDLRRGILLGAIGLSIVVYSEAASGSPNWLGLALLFVGIGYLVLWWLEDRRFTQRTASDQPTQKG